MTEQYIKSRLLEAQQMLKLETDEHHKWALKGIVQIYKDVILKDASDLAEKKMRDWAKDALESFNDI